jgi:adenylosuccinate lyase
MRAEALLGKSGMDNPYEQVKELMRGHHIGQDDVQRFIDSLNYDPETAKRLRELTPATYTGIANGLVDFARR